MVILEIFLAHLARHFRSWGENRETDYVIATSHILCFYSPGKNKSNRSDRFRHHAQSNFIAGVTYSLSSHHRISIIMRRPEMLHDFPR